MPVDDWFQWNSLFADNVKELSALQKQAALNPLASLEDARAILYDELSSKVVKGASKLQLAQTLRDGLSAYQGSVGRVVSKGAETVGLKAYRMAMDHVTEELAPVLDVPKRLVKPSIADRTIDEASVHLWEAQRKTKNTVSAQIIRDLDNKNFRGVVDQHLSQGTPILSEGFYRKTDATLKFVASEVYNSTIVKALQMLSKTHPDLVKQLITVDDNRRTHICTAAHLQIRPVDKNFQVEGDFGSWEGPHPPIIGDGLQPTFHYCRTRVRGYTERMDEAFNTGIMDTEQIDQDLRDKLA